MLKFNQIFDINNKVYVDENGKIIFKAGEFLGSSPFTIDSSGMFRIPLSVNKIKVECFGGGGGGGNSLSGANRPGSGGGGGAYSCRTGMTVTPGQTYYFSVAKQVNSQTNGEPTYFTADNDEYCYAAGGDRGQNAGGTEPGGQSSIGFGDIKYSGGNGAGAPPSGNAPGSGGGEGACTTSDGGDGTIGDSESGIPGSGGSGCDGGDGGDGGGQGVSGYDGIDPGGGGGGAGADSSENDKYGGKGARGKIIITY